MCLPDSRFRRDSGSSTGSPVCRFAAPLPQAADGLAGTVQLLDAHLHVVGLTGKDVQRLVLRLPAETS